MTMLGTKRQQTETADGALVLDLGSVEGLSGAPSSLRGLTASEPSELDGKTHDNLIRWENWRLGYKV